MSFILDALKKSEAERQRKSAPAMFEAPAARPHRSVPRWVVIAGALLVLVNLVGLLWVMMRHPATGGSTVVSTPAATAAPAAISASAASSAPVLSGPAATTTVTPPAPAATATPEPEAALPEVPEDTRIAALKRYATLGNTAPPLRLDLHVYSSNAAERYALINMRKLREGDTTEDGIKLKEITRSGVVVLYRGEELLLARE
jgi:general secretion pathway protein B